MLITGKFENERLICNRMERLYLYRNSTQICAQTGFQGYVRGHFDKGGETYFDTYFPHKTPADEGFFEALQKVMDTLRDESVLQSFRTMKNWCITDGFDSHFGGNWTTEFAFRIDHSGFAFLFRLIPEMGDYHVYVHCYKAFGLDQHMDKAENGIRFIDSHYSELFRLEDGGDIHVTETDGTEKKYTCRYVDDYHVEVGNNLFHICEFAECMEASGKRVEPISGLMLKKNAESFIEDLAAQKVQCGYVDAYVEYWHTHETGNELFAFLGMTNKEYAEWLTNGLDETLLRFAERRKKDKLE